MRKIILLVYLSTLITVYAQVKTKKGFGFGALPAISYDSDLGFQYGALVNLYDYGDGIKYPNYNHSLYLEYSTYTKGTTIARLRYDSEYFIPKVRSTFDIAYVTDNLADFYGFNGFQSIYDPALSQLYTGFYKNQRNTFRIKADFQGNFGESNFGWTAGYAYFNFAMDTINVEKLNMNYIPGGNLFQKYKYWGIISDDEAAGGGINYLKIGLKYDSRDQLACPMKGVFTEAVVQSAPGFLNKSFPHTKLALIHRQYFTLAKDLSFAYRLDYQRTLGTNSVPYFAQPLLITSYLIAATNQGLGGRGSVRGLLKNRVVGDGVGFGNFELRYKFLRFEVLNQNIYLGTNVFFDSGIIFDPINMDLSKVSDDDKSTYFSDFQKGKFHSALGAGLKVGWNENFVISIDFGKALNAQDGDKGIYIGLNYLF